jgi:serine/threonine protein phosphatase PrpC
MGSDAPPVLGRGSPAAATEPQLRAEGEAANAAYRLDGGSTAWATMRAVSVAGVRHRLAGEAGQDSFSWRMHGDTIVVAIADGLGAVPGSAAAANRAVAAAVAGAPGDASVQADLMDRVDAANDASTGGGATTLVVAAVGEDGVAAVARVGDSTAFLVSPDEWIELFGGEGDDEGIGTETEALPSDEVSAQLANADLSSGGILVLVTDGVANPWRDGPNTVAPALCESLNARPSPLELARVVDFSRQGCHDDRTLVAIWMRSP